MADLSGMFATLNAALAQSTPDASPAAAADPSAAPAAQSSAGDAPRPLTVRGGSVKDTIAGLAAALNPTPAAAAPVQPGPVPATAALAPQVAPAPRAASPYDTRAASAPDPQAAPSGDGAADALNAVEGTGRENYDAGPAEDGLTPMQRAAGIPGLASDALIQAGEAMPLVGGYLTPAAARLASVFNGRSVAENQARSDAMDADFAEKHPGLTMTARLAGGAIGTAPLVAAAPEAFGLGGGSFLARGAAAVGSNAALSGADAAARGEDVGKAAAIGGALGALGPAAEAGAVGVNAVGKAIGKAAGPIIAGVQLRGAAPGDVDALLNNARTAQAAAAKVRSLSDDPATLDARVAAAPDSAIPGAPQTLSTAVPGDQGLYNAEKIARTGPDGVFGTVDAQRSDAQLAALRGAASEGNVFRPGQMLRQRLDALDAGADTTAAQLAASHDAGVTARANATQAFTDDQQGALAARQADRAQAQQADAVSATGDLAGRIADRTDAAAADKASVDAARQAGLDAQAQGHAAQEAGLRGQAQDAASALGPMASPEATGAAFRGVQADSYAADRSARSALYKQVNPDGDLALVSKPVRDAAQAIHESVDPYDAPLSADATRLIGKARAIPDVMPFDSLTSFESDITQAMAAEKRGAGETNSYRLMGNLKGSVQNAIFDAADNQAAHEAGLVAAGQMPVEDTMEARLRSDWDWPDVGTAEGQGRATGTADAGLSRGGPSDAPDAVGTGGSAAGSSRQGASDPSLPGAIGGREGPSLTDPRFDAPLYDPEAIAQRAPPRPDVPRPQSLESFVRQRGGIHANDAGDLRSMGLNKLIAKPGAGMSADKMREAAAEAGYLGGDAERAVAETTPVDLMNALEEGHRTYSAHDTDAVLQWDEHDLAREGYDRTKGGDPALRPAGPRPKAPLSSYAPEDIYAPGTVPDPANDGLRPNMDDGALDRLAAAKAGHAEFAQTHRNNIVAPTLKTNGYAGQYLKPDGAVMSEVWKPGDAGGDRLRAFLKATKNDPRAVGAVSDYALNGLRSKIGPDGTLRQGDVDRWVANHRTAIQALSEAAPGFMDGVTTAAAADQTLIAAGLANKAEREAAQEAAAAEALATDKTRAAEMKGRNTADTDRTGAALAQRRADDRAADAADRADTSRLLAERKADDAAQNAASADAMRTGTAAARGLVKTANATPAGQFGRAAGDAVAPSEVANVVGGILRSGKDGATRMQAIVSAVQHDPEALAGLRKAGIDFIMQHVTDTDGRLARAKAINFFLDNKAALAELYPHAQQATFGALAREAMAQDAYARATKVAGSDTVKNALGVLKAGGGSKVAEHLSLMAVAAEAVSTGFEHGGVKGAAAGALTAGGAYLVKGLRDAGIRGTADLTRAALADVRVAQLLLSKAPTATSPQKAYALVGLLRRAAIYGGTPMAQAAQRRPEPGAVPVAMIRPRPGLLEGFLGAR